jgi:hypothetical protein
VIPKRIHYCWFGGNQKPELVKKYIATWGEYCPDFEIIEWNESNFDIYSHLYTKEAYQAKKWAFITDYVRLLVIYKYGGIYMDADVEMLKPLDIFLKHSAFSGFEREQVIPTGIMGGIAGHKWYEALLDYYKDRHFILPDGSYEMISNVIPITSITKELYGIDLNNTYQELNDGLVFYQTEFFCPKHWATGAIALTENTHCIHHFTASLMPERDQLYMRKSRRIVEILGPNIFSKSLIHCLYFGKRTGEIGIINTVVYF